MKKYLYDYIKEIDEKLEKDNIDYKKLMSSHLIKIQFFQHERLIHLLVTLFYTVFMILFLGLSFLFPIFFVIFFVLIIFELFYVVHYFRLENGVQYLYKQYDKMEYRVKRWIRYLSMFQSMEI